MMQAMHDHRKVQEEKIKIQARIIKLRKDEERAAKRIRDNLSQVEFRERMHQVKLDKMMTKKQHYSALRDQEERNRSSFIQRKHQQKFISVKNKKDLYASN
jgi:hypothetical protein